MVCNVPVRAAKEGSKIEALTMMFRQEFLIKKTGMKKVLTSKIDSANKGMLIIDFNLPNSFFRQTDETKYEPTEATIGPWSSAMQHGGPPSALRTNALRVFPSLDDLKIARITIEFFSAVPVKPCEIRIEIVRPGKKIELLGGEYISGGKTFLLAFS